MKYTQLFGKTTKNETKTKFISHHLLVKGGFIRESSAGRYYFLPLGWRVHEKIKQIIKLAMDETGAQEMITPVLHPLELWKETNRTNSAGFELTTLKDRRGSAFALGGTAEEMFVDLVRQFQLSYKDLPFNVYQFSTKFRDELRSRGGLLRVREFTMKDAYSFHQDENDFKREYQLMTKTYYSIFKKIGLETLMVEADNGYIGGEYCHEFQVLNELGEGRFFVSQDNQYIAHEDIAEFAKEDKNLNDKLAKYQEIKAIRGTTMIDGAKLHNLPMWQQLKDVMYVDEKKRMILAIIRGDLDVNEIKLKHLTGSYELRHATAEEIHHIGSEPGFISPVGLEKKVLIVADDSLRTVKNMYGGANKQHLDALNMNIDRDFVAKIEGDIAMAQAGFLTKNNHGELIEKRGIEVGNIFQLGYHYTKLMTGATFTNQTGQEKPYYMGCYGIGLGRTIATVVENYHDHQGIIWPAAITPFAVELISLEGVQATTTKAYNMLKKAKIDVLWDDRIQSAGSKFADADLIGIPIRLVISKKTGNHVEWKLRTNNKKELITIQAAIKRIIQFYRNL